METTSTATVQLTVRYFAAARAAANAETETVLVVPGTTVAGLVDTLGTRSSELAKVLRRCSLLCDGIAVRDEAIELSNDQTIDVLPPFAGG
jgi:molybdopterin synthase sulfur carrier subunit